MNPTPSWNPAWGASHLEESFAESRFGQIVHLDEKEGQVWVNYQGNPGEEPCVAQLGRPFFLKDLRRAWRSVQAVRLTFVEQDPQKPVIQDIYYSILETEKKEGLEKEEIHIKTKRLILEGTEEVFIRSGEAMTRYVAKGGKRQDSANSISSQAQRNYTIRGGNVNVN